MQVPRYAVEFAGFIYVDAENEDSACEEVDLHLYRVLDDFEIISVKDITSA
jgi:hypothetical protein